jgi:hypothetical protein
VDHRVYNTCLTLYRIYRKAFIINNTIKAVERSVKVNRQKTKLIHADNGDKSKGVVKVKMLRLKIHESFPQFGNRVYRFSNSDIPVQGWVEIDLSHSENERKMFLNINEKHVAVVLVHACPKLPDGVRYVWQGRIYEPPAIPAACPRCRYRLDYAPKRG